MTLPPAHPLAFPYLPGEDASSFLEALEASHPWLAELIEYERLAAQSHHLTSFVNEFEVDGESGRGGSYRRATEQVGVRGMGMRKILELARATEGKTLLDVLGGDGELARVSRTAGLNARVITSDAAQHMVAAARAGGQPALRQMSDGLILRDTSVDAVFVGYGTHHIGRESRRATISESYRVLRPGGRLVIHDFEPEGAMAAWFRHVVHPNAPGGHPHQHVGAAEMWDLLANSRWATVEIQEIDDPFTASGDTALGARLALVHHLRALYGIREEVMGGISDEELESSLTEHFGCENGGHAIPRVTETLEGFRATVNRRAVVGVATRAG